MKSLFLHKICIRSKLQTYAAGWKNNWLLEISLMPAQEQVVAPRYPSDGANVELAKV